MMSGNKELEDNLKEVQNENEEQRNEIDFLTKKITYLNDVIDTRIRIYDKLSYINVYCNLLYSRNKLVWESK